jgi:hypothetical protein
MTGYPEHNLAHMPGPDVPDDQPPIERSDLYRDEICERLEDAVGWMRLARSALPYHYPMRKSLDAAIDAFEQEGW